MNQSFQFADPDSAINAIAAELAPVTESESAADPVSRMLAQPVLADRDSPAADVSAMDGYAIRLGDLKADVDVPIFGESKTGSPPPTLDGHGVVRIFTGAIVPTACDAVVKREDTVESSTSIRFLDSALDNTIKGSHIRRRGENALAGSLVLPAGIEITPAVIAALANFGQVQPAVNRRVKVAVLTTGNEVVAPANERLEDWQLRNSNQAAIHAMLDQQAFIDVHCVEHVPDDRDSLTAALQAATQSCDAVALTGGVSKGDYDYVPETITKVGGQIIFHGLPIRPGKPILGAVTGAGKLILGLPGNPVSATINCHRFLLPLLRRIGGKVDWSDRPLMTTLRQPPAKAIPLHTLLLSRAADDGFSELVGTKGSGDLVALGQSDGYVCVPPSTTTTGPWPMFRW